MKYDLVLLQAPSVYDFRKNSLLAGPISDVVPSSPVFEMYPIGFTSIADYLERYGLRVKIINIANRMLMNESFDVNHPSCLQRGSKNLLFCRTARSVP